jgi:hypothetical protein
VCVCVWERERESTLRKAHAMLGSSCTNGKHPKEMELLPSLAFPKVIRSFTLS